MKKRMMTLALAFALTMTGIPVSAADSSTPANKTTETVESTSVVDANKIPRQLNVHVGTDASSQVNVTYTTVADTETMITLNKVGSTEEIRFTGTSYKGIGGKYIHEIAVTGLESFTEYEYTVGDGFNEYDGTFKTALDKNDDGTFTFSYLADTQVSNATDAKALGATLAKVNELNPDFVYIAGDVTNTNNSENQWQWLFNNDGLYPTGGEDMFANNLLAVTQGNHDNNEMYQHINAPEEAGKIVYSFDYGCSKFIILNSEAARSNEDARAQQEAYLREAVADAKANGQWTFVGFHKSLYTGASHVVDGDIIAARKFWSPILSELDVDFVLQGHDHVYSRGFVNAQGQNARPEAVGKNEYIDPANAPLYMVGGHAGGLKWYDRKNYTVSEGDPIALNYDFLDVNSAAMNSAGKKEQVMTTFTVSDEKVEVKTTNFKYDTAKDEITTDEYTYDSFSVQRNTEEETRSYVEGTDVAIIEENDTVEYTVSYSGLNNANAFETAVSYDTEKLELVKAESCLENTVFTDVQDENGVADVIVGTTAPLSGPSKKEVVKYTFALKDGVKAGSTKIELVKANTVKNNQTNANDVVSRITDAEVVTLIHSYKDASDVNKDGKWTLADLSIALNYYQTTETAYDINLDGIVNTLDYVLISEYIR